LQEYIFVIQRDLPTLEEHVSSLQKHKVDLQNNFEKVEGQIEYRFMFIATREAKLSWL
jgi:hypothetical protein